MKKWKRMLLGTMVLVISLQTVAVNIITPVYAKEVQKEETDDYIDRHPKACEETYKLSKFPQKSAYDDYDLPSADLSNVNLLKQKNKLLLSSFNSKTIWPKELPKGFNPVKIMELYKTPGLNIDKLHKKGIDGKNIGIAIIDQVLLVDHTEYKERLKYYKEGKVFKQYPVEMHGPAVASIAVGKSVGVAPKADLYYIAEYFGQKNMQIVIAKDLCKILDLNKSLPKNKKIRVISISWGCENKKQKGYKNYLNALNRAKSEGVFVVTPTLYTREDMKGEDLDYFGLIRKPLTSPNDMTAYIPYDWCKECTGWNEGKILCAPMWNMCVASNTGVNDYSVYAFGGISWTTPYIAGVYALACQVKPDITYKEFWNVALKTAFSNKTDYKGKHYEVPKIINPVRLIEELQNNK